MARETEISWADHTGNPWIGCTVAHTGCKNCYARTLSENKSGKTPGPWAIWGRGKDRLVTKGFWTDVFSWAKAARKAGLRRALFASLMDPLDPEVYERTGAPEGVADRRTFDAYMRVLDQVAAGPRTPGLVPLLLTKRPENWRWIPEHVRPYCWLIYSASDQATLDAGMPHLLAAEGFAGRGLSLEPLVGAIDLSVCWGTPPGSGHVGWSESGQRISWVIIGGESGSKSRPCNVEWIRALVRQCREAGTTPYVKQLGARIHWGDLGGYSGSNMQSRAFGGITHPAGADPAEWPEAFPQEWPEGLR